MNATDTKTLVRDWYGTVATGDAKCCGPNTAQEASSSMGYSEAELASLPEGADLGLGCGKPQAMAAMRSGDVVVDLGSGAGIDCFLAARQVGPGGRVIGVDMTQEMLAKARANAERVGATNVEFRLGEIEHLPIADNTADVVISNCVINLVPDKAQVYREAFRVLKPGGRIAIADVVNTAPLPPELSADATLLCTCLAGAAPTRQVEDWLAAAGLTDIRIAIKPGSRELVASWAPGRGIEDYVASATIEGRKPDGVPSSRAEGSSRKHYLGGRRSRRVRRSAKARISPAENTMQIVAPKPPRTAVSTTSPASRPSKLALTAMTPPTSKAHAPALIASCRRFSAFVFIVFRPLEITTPPAPGLGAN